jgi:hypothetical protein
MLLCIIRGALPSDPVYRRPCDPNRGISLNLSFSHRVGWGRSLPVATGGVLVPPPLTTLARLPPSLALASTLSLIVLPPFIAPTSPQLAARGEVAVIVRRAFVDDSLSSRCVGGPSHSIACHVVATDASEDRRRRCVPPRPPRHHSQGRRGRGRVGGGKDRRRDTGGGGAGRRGNWDRLCSHRRGRGRWR